MPIKSVRDETKKADEKRLKLALKRIQARRAWEARHQMDAIDLMAALEEIHTAEPEYFVTPMLRDRGGVIS